MVTRATMKILNVGSVDVCPWALREGIVLHYLQSIQTSSFDLPLRPLTGASYQGGSPGSTGVMEEPEQRAPSAPAHPAWLRT